MYKEIKSSFKIVTATSTPNITCNGNILENSDTNKHNCETDLQTNYVYRPNHRARCLLNQYYSHTEKA